ncbi:MAG: hypothetical protein KC457_36030, partial [Myxococcales bacterium]|nr:hypothetical protein [Myxococcales bacterium]
VEVVRPARRIFEWSMPVAAAGLVMMLGMSVLHEGAAVAGSAEASASFPSLGAETEIVVAADAAPVVPLMQPLPPAPEVVAVPEPAPKSKSSKSKTSKSKTSSSKTSSSKSSSDDSKRKNPLILGDFDGNPLG